MDPARCLAEGILYSYGPKGREETHVMSWQEVDLMIRPSPYRQSWQQEPLKVTMLRAELRPEPVEAGARPTAQEEEDLLSTKPFSIGKPSTTIHLLMARARPKSSLTRCGRYTGSADTVGIDRFDAFMINQPQRVCEVCVKAYHTLLHEYERKQRKRILKTQASW